MDTLIKELFDEIDFEQFSGCEKVSPGATSCARCCARQYFDGNEIDYSCEQKMKVYAVRYYPVHMEEIATAVDSSLHMNGVEDILLTRDLSILSLGGGPGSDILGIRKRIRGYASIDSKNTYKVSFTRIEVNPIWDNIFYRAVALGTTTQNLSEEYKTIHHDLTLNESVVLPKQDIILMSYLMSELSDAEAYMLAHRVKDLMKSNALIIINDRPEDAVKNRIKKFLDIILPSESKEHYFTYWGGFTYPEDIKNKMEPKLNMNVVSFISVRR